MLGLPKSQTSIASFFCTCTTSFSAQHQQLTLLTASRTSAQPMTVAGDVVQSSSTSCLLCTYCLCMFSQDIVPFSHHKDVSSCYYLKTFLFVPYKATIGSFFLFFLSIVLVLGERELYCWPARNLPANSYGFQCFSEGDVCSSLLFYVFIKVHVL